MTHIKKIFFSCAVAVGFLSGQVSAASGAAGKLESGKGRLYETFWRHRYTSDQIRKAVKFLDEEYGSRVLYPAEKPEIYGAAIFYNKYDWDDYLAKTTPSFCGPISFENGKVSISRSFLTSHNLKDCAELISLVSDQLAATSEAVDKL